MRAIISQFQLEKSLKKCNGGCNGTIRLLNDWMYIDTISSICALNCCFGKCKSWTTCRYFYFLGIIFQVHGVTFSTLRPRQNGRHFANDTFKRIFLNENVRISITISLKFVPKGSINNIPALVQIMVWRRPGDKPLSEPMMDNLPTHIYVTRPQWVNRIIIHTITHTAKCADHCGLFY